MTQADRQEQLAEWINQATDYQCGALTMVSGDASFRRYFRFRQQGMSVIAVDAPVEHENSEQFVHVANAYYSAGVPVPKVLATDFDKGFYLLEDFGDRQFATALSAQTFTDLYRRALAHLPAIQTCTMTADGALPAFDDALLDREFHLFSHWLLEVHLQLSLTEQEKALMTQCFGTLRENFHAQPQAGVHRDYHSRNLMMPSDDTIGVIDFQDAVIGPVTYDLVSLLRDCYQCWPKANVLSLAEEFQQRFFPTYDWPQFKRWFDLTGMQRHVKASGIFARLCHRDGKTGYLNDIPRTLDYLIDVGAEYDEFREFAAFVDTRVKPAVEAQL